MSDKPQGVKRNSVRILRLEKVGSAPSQSRKSSPSSPDLPSGSRPAGRHRSHGAPLSAPTRFQKPARQINGDAFIAALAASTGDVPSTFTPPTGETLPKDPVEDAERPDAATVIIWEQPPQPVEPLRDDVPRWVSDASLTPTEEEFAALGACLSFMIDGFTTFCRLPSIEESGNWHARLRMPAVVMPETMLDVNISPLHARLRFETDNRVARELLGRYVGQLQAQVKAVLEDTREVEVSVW